MNRGAGDDWGVTPYSTGWKIGIIGFGMIGLRISSLGGSSAVEGNGFMFTVRAVHFRGS